MHVRALSVMKASPSSQKKVAVVGAGAAGLVAARELRRENIDVTVFERGNEVGGTWVYSGARQVGQGEEEERAYHIHSSVYDTLRVNLPREIMGYSDYPFASSLCSDGGDDRRYCSHREVLRYLQNFARDEDIEALIQKNTLVISASPTETENETNWKVTHRTKGREEKVEETFDALVVCNGHFEVPRLIASRGIEAFPGQQIHSRDYKRNDVDVFVDKSVLVVGTGPSGDDLSREVSKVARNVYWSGRLFTRIEPERLLRIKDSLNENVSCLSNVSRVDSDGTVHFDRAEDLPVKVDTILWCTGYEYQVPFLDPALEISTSSGRIEPLYEHLFHPKFGSKLSFIGLGFRILPFPFFEIQSKWVAKCIAGGSALPSKAEMLADAEDFYGNLQKEGIREEMTRKFSFSFSHYFSLSLSLSLSLSFSFRFSFRGTDLFFLCSPPIRLHGWHPVGLSPADRLKARYGGLQGIA